MKTLKAIDRSFASEGADECINMRVKNGVIETIKKQDKTSLTGSITAQCTIDSIVYIATATANIVSIFESKTKVFTHTVNSVVQHIVASSNGFVIQTSEVLYEIYREGQDWKIDYRQEYTLPTLDISGYFQKKQSSSIQQKLEGNDFKKLVAELSHTLYAKLTDLSVNNALGEGVFAIRIAYKTKRNTIVSTSAPIVIDATTRNAVFRYGIDNYTDKMYTVTMNKLRQAKVTLQLSGVSGTTKDKVKSILIYSTRVICPYEFTEFFSSSVDGNHDEHFPADELTTLKIDSFVDKDIYDKLDNELYYLAKEIPMSTYHENYTVEIDKEFMKDIETKEDFEIALENKSFTGTPFFFNTRIHIFDITERYETNLLQSVCSQSSLSYKCYAKINGKAHLVGRIAKLPTSELNAFLAIPFIADELLIDDDRGNIHSISLQKSSRHNYSFARVPDLRYINDPYDPSAPAAGFSFTPIYEAIHTYSPGETPNNETSFQKTSIRVSYASSLSSFPVDYSYKFDGEINALAINTEQISSSQIGQFPLYVFTNAGIFALEQGNGDVLYSRIIPISIDVAIKVVQTIAGVAYITQEGAVKLLQGGSSLELSTVLAEKVDKGIRDNTSFVKCTNHAQLNTMFQHVSKISFTEYAKNAILGYDSLNKEIIVSNDSHSYSYVFNIQSKAWHKISSSFKYFSNNLGIATNNDIIELNTESEADIEICYLTMPISLESHTIMDQLAILGDIRPSVSDKFFGLYIFGSTDKQSWQLVGARQITAKAVADVQQNAKQFVAQTPQIIMPKIGRTYKYLRLLVCGETSKTKLASYNINARSKYNRKIR